MRDPFDIRRSTDEGSGVVRQFLPLPIWLEGKLLNGAKNRIEGEEITWVTGPRSNPFWERFATHPLLILIGLLLGVGCLALGRMSVTSWDRLPLAAFLTALVFIFGSVFAVGISCGYFTRLVVTSHRLFIVQGREICRIWPLAMLPPHLIRHRMTGDEGKKWMVDVDAVRTMLGGMADQYADAKTILEFRKKLEQIQGRGGVAPKE